MTQPSPAQITQPGTTSHRFFARRYERLSRSKSEQKFMNPLREEAVGQMHGVVLEVGVGTGLNFAFYDPEQVERVEAVEPDAAMLGYARERVKAARVPVVLTQAPVENLPFEDGTFDSALATLVFCSVGDPLHGFREIYRVLKPGGALVLIEHVRAKGAIAGRMQDMVTPMTKLLLGNCHWNRDTEHTIGNAGFQIGDRRGLTYGLLPMLVLRATKKEA